MISFTECALEQAMVGISFNAIFFPRFILYNFCFFMVVWGFGVGVLIWVFGVGVFSWWVLLPVVWGLLGFLAWSSLYKHKRITLGKKWCSFNTSYYIDWPISLFWQLVGLAHFWPTCQSDRLPVLPNIYLQSPLSKRNLACCEGILRWS